MGERIAVNIFPKVVQLKKKNKTLLWTLFPHL